MAPVEVPSNILLPAGYDIFWSAVCFAVIALVLGRKVLPTFTAMLDERSEKIEGGLKAGEIARAEAAQLRTALEAERAEARREAAVIRAEAHDQARLILQEARQKATAEAEEIAENMRRTIEAQRQAAEVSLRTDIGLLASELAARIVGESLRDSELQARVIDRFLDELDASTPVPAEET